MSWVVFVAGLCGLVLLHLSALAVGSRWVKIGPESIQLGFGPTVKSFAVGGVPVRLQALPLGGSVGLREDASVLQRLVVGALASGSLVLLGVLVLGLDSAIDVGRDAIVLPLTGALSPTVDAQATLQRIVDAVASGSTFGAAALTLGLTNLLHGAASAAATRHVGLQIAIAMATLALAVPWAYALVVFAL